MHKILIVEPSDNVAVTIRAVLEEHGFAVDVIAHANEVEPEKLLAYAVLVLDVHRENADAFALLGRVHREIPHLTGRIIVISADDTEAITHALDLLGVCDIVPKPVDAEEIVRAVFDCLGTEPA